MTQPRKSVSVASHVRSLPVKKADPAKDKMTALFQSAFLEPVLARAVAKELGREFPARGG